MKAPLSFLAFGLTAAVAFPVQGGPTIPGTSAFHSIQEWWGVRQVEDAFYRRDLQGGIARAEMLLKETGNHSELLLTLLWDLGINMSAPALGQSPLDSLALSRLALEKLRSLDSFSPSAQTSLEVEAILYGGRYLPHRRAAEKQGLQLSPPLENRFPELLAQGLIPSSSSPQSLYRSYIQSSPEEKQEMEERLFADLFGMMNR
ncbi:MAG: hypothetical protein QGH51_08185 [Planctomycetota bacterium]|jgi:hypothetical protein|nr:hypothetical protein [Planctomycetota bacterium]MDP6941986.1 hypothetical protein [Planctomycetota bacterium]